MIKLSEPFFFGSELTHLKKCIKTQWVSSAGGEVKKFENRMKKFSSGKYNLATVNCTVALQLAVRLLNPAHNDEIIVPTITFIATINSVIYNNCKPIFMDCDEQLIIDKKKIYNFIKKNTFFSKGHTYNKKTKKKILSIIIVNTFGNLFDLDNNFIKFCKKKNIKIIEDAAESLGSFFYDKDRYKPKNVDFSCYSFNANKLITAGGGGLISMNNKSDFKKAIYLATQAKNDIVQFIHDDVGYNIRMSNLHAAIGLSQISNLKKVLKKKRLIFEKYKSEINSIKGLTILSGPKYCNSNYWLNILVIDQKKYGLSKKSIINGFLKFKVETRSLWYPNHLQKPFLKFEKFNLNKAKKMFERCICIPSSYGLKISDQKKIIKLLKNKFKN